jgi:hypothetical protein
MLIYNQRGIRDSHISKHNFANGVFTIVNLRELSLFNIDNIHFHQSNHYAVIDEIEEFCFLGHNAV